MYNINHNFTYRQKDKGWQVILSYKDGDKWRQKSIMAQLSRQKSKDFIMNIKPWHSLSALLDSTA